MQAELPPSVGLLRPDVPPPGDSRPTQRVLSEARDDPAIRTGNEANRLELRCAGLRIEASVNGKVVASADDTTLDRGEHGIVAGMFSGVEGHP